jgi:hypothetical protein
MAVIKWYNAYSKSKGIIIDFTKLYEGKKVKFNVANDKEGIGSVIEEFVANKTIEPDYY